MKIDSILKVPLDNGMSMERTITSDGDVEITITDDEGREFYSEEILRTAGGTGSDEEQVFHPADADTGL